jgi:anthranilate synthase component 1
MPHIRPLKDRPSLLALHRARPERYPFLLQSVAHAVADQGQQARYDILFAFPGRSLRLDPGAHHSADFLEQLDAQWQAARPAEQGRGELPFAGGWFLYLGYELAAQVEPSLTLPSATDGLPTACAVRIPAAVIIDHVSEQCFLVAEAGQEVLLDAMVTDIQGLANAATPAPLAVQLTEEAPARYLHGVQRIKHYIVEGDVFQVNLSRPWRGELPHPATAADLYQRLCRHNPAPFAGLAVIGDAAIICSSPERLVRVSDGVVETRPIAGTRPRSGAPEDDHALQAELLAHPKERAEHIMLIDLERNDLGRVCEPGSVAVDELMVLESYAHVHHIVSNVRGRLRPAVTPGQVIRAVFPGGTITGCPKVRCMAIIAELEGEGRGAYTGSMGYLNHDGSLDLNILIRTMTLHGQQLSLRAGAGIVADSVPDRELDETRAKARGLLLALTEGQDPG